MASDVPPKPPRMSATFDEHTLAEIRRAARTGIYDIRGGGAKRALHKMKTVKPQPMSK